MVNIGGLLNGTAVADHWSEWPRNWLATAGFALRGHGTASIESMTTEAGRTRFAGASLPPNVLVVNYLGVPMSSDVHSGVRGRYELLAEHGPNDGLTLLADAIVPQGVTLVGRGLDHFLADPDQDRVVAAMAQAVLDTLEDEDARQPWSGVTGSYVSHYSGRPRSFILIPADGRFDPEAEVCRERKRSFTALRTWRTRVLLNFAGSRLQSS